jgi:23S rRNA (pseudouridine1915-N3)-methyltransferase
MKVLLVQTGKTDFQYITDGSNIYIDRIKKYLPFEIITLIAKKNKPSEIELIKKNEGILILEKIMPSDWVILLDEHGKQTSSVDFSAFIQQKMNTGIKRLVFVIGGAYGFSDNIVARANDKLSLSRMTFSHQIVRLIFLEQFYRALTIIKGEPYHHE